MSIKLSLLLTLSLGAATAMADSQNLTWTAVFSKAEPISSSTTQAYCNAHSPSKIIATVNQATSKPGVKALNGINLYYSSYKSVGYDNLYFTFINAVASGQDQNGSWSDKMKVYGQSLTQNDVINGVWSSSYCRGLFLAKPSPVSSS
ncbi:MAG: hypothetical protein K0R66_66 [Gammaproteobacteria bacterium]|jgi:hypothetical protein|nr:hypothetical protein [Gammaproteobacteria bacterium]